MTRFVAVFFAVSVATASADLGTAAAYSAAQGEKALLVWEKGRVVFERGPALSETPRIFSITKSLFSIGIFRDAVKGGISLGRPVSRGPASGVSLGDLMNQTSGLDPMSGQFYSTGLEDKARVFSAMQPPRRERGFVYGASHWEVLGEEIVLASGAPLESWLRRFVPGVHSDVLARWRRDGKGRMFVSTGARMSARDLLPAARGVLTGMGQGLGRWPAVVRNLLASGTPENGMYALGFWLNRNALSAHAREVDVENSLDPPPAAKFWRQGRLSRAAPADLLAMIGTGGQRVYIVPSRDLIVVRLGAGNFSDAEFLARYFALPSKVSAKERG
jgi:CubicO group peptidase (beta-lactamase class C family)